MFSYVRLMLTKKDSQELRNLNIFMGASRKSVVLKLNNVWVQRTLGALTNLEKEEDVLIIKT